MNISQLLSGLLRIDKFDINTMLHVYKKIQLCGLSPTLEKHNILCFMHLTYAEVAQKCILVTSSN